MRAQAWRWLMRALAAVAVAGVVVIAALYLSLPSVGGLYARTPAPATLLLDRHGTLLYEMADPRTGRATPLAAEAIPPCLRDGTVAVEDASFYANPGVDIVGVARALWINLREGEVRAGGSTITQQLARNMLLEPDERSQRTLLRKVRESMLALLITARYSKSDILALYLNTTYYGNLAYGVNAAAQAYFGVPVAQLDTAECALIVGLGQSPALYDPFLRPEAAKARQLVVLDLMQKQGVVTADQAAIARQARLAFAPAAYPIRAPHFVGAVRVWLEERFGPEALVRGGLRVTTTLDANLNDAATSIMRMRLAQLQQPDPATNQPAHNANDAALVALDPHSGDILAMVGSPDYFDMSISGAVNAAIALRQPGSAIKPVTYAAAFARLPGFTAATPLQDERTAFPTREGDPYVPANYDRRNHGWITARDALATSNNVAAVSVLQQTGVDTMLDVAHALGLQSLNDADRYGLALTLGGGEVRLIELTAAYAAFANLGRPVEPVYVLEVRDGTGKMLYGRPVREPAAQVIDPRVAWLISDILSDNDARSAAFGAYSPLRLSRPAAVKTGTTTDWRDNWTVGYTPDLVTGVWVGNADGEPMEHITGVTGAAPIWNDFMEAAQRGMPARPFERPAGLHREDACALISETCALMRPEWFLDGTHAPDVSAMIDATQPAVALAQPDDGSTYRMSAQLPVDLQRIPIEARVSPRVRAQGVARVEVLVDGGAHAIQLTGEPWRGFWPLTPGVHAMLARVTLKDGATLDSSVVEFEVLK